MRLLITGGQCSVEVKVWNEAVVNFAKGQIWSSGRSGGKRGQPQNGVIATTLTSLSSLQALSQFSIRTHNYLYNLLLSLVTP